MNKKEFSPYIRLAMFSTLAASFSIEERVIFDYEIILVSDGKCKITIDNTEYMCKKNDVVFLRPGVPHKFECLPDFDFVQPHIHFDIFYSDKSEERYISFKPKKEMSEQERTLFHEDILFDADIPNVFTPYDMGKFQKLFFEIIEIFQEKAYNYELICKAKMLELLGCILTQFEKDRTIKADIAYEPVIDVKNYIDNNYLSVITLESLSKQFHFNKYTLLRKFKAMYNKNLMTYYRSKRIEYIKNALKTTNLPITSLSEKLNFSDIYSFSRFFKNYVGCSPSTYRKR